MERVKGIESVILLPDFVASSSHLAPGYFDHLSEIGCTEAVFVSLIVTKTTAPPMPPLGSRSLTKVIPGA